MQRKHPQAVEKALQADLRAARSAQPPRFELDAALTRFSRQTRNDPRAAAWAAAIEQEPASGVLTNVVDKIGIVKLTVAGVCLFTAAATAGTLGVIRQDPDSRADLAAGEDAPPSGKRTHSWTPQITQLPLPEPPQPRVVRHRPALDVAPVGVEQEIEHMVTLRKLVDTQPSRALAWAERGHRQFTNGLLFEEREALYVLALIKVRGVSAARPRAKAFLRRYPKGSFAARIEQAVRR